MEKFTLINKARLRVKVFEPLKDGSKYSSIINPILISYSCVFKRSSRAVIKGALEFIQLKKAEKKILEEGR